MAKVEDQIQKLAGGTKPSEQQGKILEWLWHLKKKGLSETSIYDYGLKLRQLAKQCNVLEPEAVKETIAEQKWSKATKAYVVVVYNEFVKWLGVEWEPPIYKPVRKLPFIPTEQELDQLIAASGPKLATFLQLLKETGIRRGEATRLRWVDLDFERKTVRINAPEKGSNPGIFRISNKLAGMLQRLPKEDARIFRFSMPSNFYAQRKKIARKLNNRRIPQIHLHTFRHWKGTMEYHKTHDLIHVQQILRHRDIKSTMLYIQVAKAIFQSSNDEFHVSVAKTVEEACKLVEVGFEYVTEINGAKIFRKRK